MPCNILYYTLSLLLGSSVPCRLCKESLIRARKLRRLLLSVHHGYMETQGVTQDTVDVSEDGFTFSDVLNMLILDMILFSILGWYLGNVSQLTLWVPGVVLDHPRRWQTSLGCRG